MGGPIEDERTSRMIFFPLLFFDGWWVLQNSLFSVLVVVCCAPPPRIWKTLTHLCRTTSVLQAQKRCFLPDLWCHPLHVRDLLQLAAGPICFLHQPWLFLGHWEMGLLDQAIRFWICWEEKEENKICYLYLYCYLSELWPLLWFMKAPQWYLDSNITKILKLVLLRNAKK